VKNITLKTGNILSDLTDHLPNYTLNKSKKLDIEARLLRTFSQKHKQNFLNYLQVCGWNQIYRYREHNVYTAYNKFLGFSTTAVDYNCSW